MNNMVASGQLGNSQLAPSSNQNKIVQLGSGQFEDYLVQALNDSLMKKSKSFLKYGVGGVAPRAILCYNLSISSCHHTHEKPLDHWQLTAKAAACLLYFFLNYSLIN